LVSVAFLAWKRRSDFVASSRAAWNWIWIGRIDESKGFIRALTRQLAIYAGLFFVFFAILSPKVESQDSPPWAQSMMRSIEGVNSRVEHRVEVPIQNLWTEFNMVRTTLENRTGLTAYLDKSRLAEGGDRSTFDLMYLVLFENASLKADSQRGITLDPGERNRLVAFAQSLRGIGEGSKSSDKANKLIVEVRGFASEAPKAMTRAEKDETNTFVANARAKLVHKILSDELKGVNDLRDPVVWDVTDAMRASRGFDDTSISRQTVKETAAAEAPNRRVEILITLPTGLRFGLRTDIADHQTPHF
jgi:hypothetical protein